MIKLLFQLKSNKLFIEEKKRMKTPEKMLINTNIISRDELIFSDEYIEVNPQLINNFIREIVKSYNINTLIIKELKYTPLILNTLTNIPEIKNLYLLEENIVTYEICEAIINTNSKECFFI